MSLILLLISLTTWGATQDLRVGDILLQPLNCWACSLIEAEEETIFSHAGVVLQTEPEVKIAEAFGSVRLVTLSEFNAKTEAGQNILVLRFRSSKIRQEFATHGERLLMSFENDFFGREYDSEFRWNNFDEAGEEKLYCSELISKLFQRFIQIELPIKRMHFETNREAWVKYFKGNVPDREWGNSPGDLERSELFYHVGEL